MKVERRKGSTRSFQAGRLRARPTVPAMVRNTEGLTHLGLDSERDALLFIPESYSPERPAPLAIMLHGAGGNARHGLDLLLSAAEQAGLIILAPPSREETWDIIAQRRYGPDVAFIDRALEATFSRCAVDLTRIALGGFSDGASYALSLGLLNGDFLTHLIAFSPGFVAQEQNEGEEGHDSISPQLFVSHGTGDRILPVNMCSRRIVPQLRNAGYDVHYTEFKGPHTVPPEIMNEALSWFLERH